jgi:glutamate carboxypeptidase
MVRLLRELVELESPTGHTRAIADRMASELESLGGAVTRVSDHVVAEFAGAGTPLLVLGHTDTVWDVGTLARLPWRLEDGRAFGPGSYDMKAGLVVCLAALAGAGADRRAVRVLLNADEEMGSPTGREVISDAAGGVAAAFVVEPPLANGGLKTARKGLGRFRFTISGRAAHAGTNLADGASATEELAHQVIRLHRLNDPERGISVNVGVVRGGTRENVVAELAEAEVDVRLTHAADLEPLERALRETTPTVPNTSIEVTGRWTRPPLEPTPGSAKLFARAREHGRALGLDLVEGASGGGSDGNLVGALGVPVLDGLGAEGGGAHAVDEHVIVDSLPVRSCLLAALLRDPGL